MFEVIKSNRSFEDWPSWDIIHEWEDIISNEFNIPLYENDIIIRLLKKIPLKRISDKFCKTYLYTKILKKKALVFHIIPFESNYEISKYDIPIVIDIWGDVNIKKFNKTYARCEIVYVTSKEVQVFLQDKTDINIKYLPLTLPNQYFLGDYNKPKNREVLMNKDIDILEMGRPNNILNGWIKEYLVKYPDTHYVYRKLNGNKIYMYSNKFGFLFEQEGRKSYFELLKRARVSLYSSAGIDEGHARTGGFNAMTPRLLEILSQFNYVIARYADNIEFENVKNKIPNCSSYQMFEDNLNRYIFKGDIEFLIWSNVFLSSCLTTTLTSKF